MFILGDYMLKTIFIIIKKILLSIVLMFGSNIFLSFLNVNIPLNLFTIFLVTFLDVPSIVGLVLFYVINY